MKKNIKHNPETIKTVDDPLLRQFSKEERDRFEYKTMRNNKELYTLKYDH
jgi:hypothetical protein